MCFPIGTSSFPHTNTHPHHPLFSIHMPTHLLSHLHIPTCTHLPTLPAHPTHTTLHTASQPSHGGSLEDSAYRCYRKRSGEEALLERKQKRRRISSSLDYFCKRDARDLHKSHYQYLLKLHQQSNSNNSTPCTSSGCDHPCLPFSTRCSRHILMHPDSTKPLVNSYTGRP